MQERIAIDQIKHYEILLTWKITTFQTLYKTLKAATHSQNLWEVTEPQIFLLTPFHGVKEFPKSLESCDLFNSKFSQSMFKTYL